MATTLEHIVVVLSSTGKVYKVDKVEKKVHIYANETQYGLDNEVGWLPISEFTEIFEFVRSIDASAT